MSFHSSQPIGIFDSGVGGLTCANALTQLLPNENIIYFGDVAHHPYGEKSIAALQAYAIKICDMLLKQQVKLILIACNSASAAANELVKEYVGSKAKVVNVIDPAVNFLRENFLHKKIGLIGTHATINSNIYQKKIKDLNFDIHLESIATPLLAPMIEEGYIHNEILIHTLSNYLSHDNLKDIDALLLGCTHYPLIKNQIRKFYDDKVFLIDSSEVTALAVRGLLEHHHLLNKNPSPQHKFYVSDYTESFVSSARFFFPETLHFEHFPLWE
jgi:glutamate racemase